MPFSRKHIIHKSIHFRSYNTMPKPANNQAETDEWVIQSSKVANRDLSPCFEFWGWELTDRVKTEIGNLTAYFWKDEATDD